MLQGLRSKQQVIAWCLALCSGLFAGLVQAQPELPGRVGRVADLSGSVWVFDDEAGDWTLAERNRPVTGGDRVSTSADGRIELRIGSTTLRLGARSELEVLRLDDERMEFQLHAGSAALRIRTREAAAEAQFSTPEARFKIMRSGHYRFDRSDDTSFAASLSGELLLEGPVSFPIGAGQRMEFWRERAGPAAPALQHRWSSLPNDALAQWIARDEQVEQRSASSRYVSPEMTGAEDLDRHGRWDHHPEYGAIWMPISVAVGWAPYRHGRWIWLRPWGWTWVDQQPWGFAPFHYGRWVQWRGQWCWSPGSYVARPVYAPALVSWVGGPQIGVGVGVTIGTHTRRPLPGSSWVPLAPRQPYVPHHHASSGWSERVNRGHGSHEPQRELPARPAPTTTHALPVPVPVRPTAPAVQGPLPSPTVQTPPAPRLEPTPPAPTITTPRPPRGGPPTIVPQPLPPGVAPASPPAAPAVAPPAPTITLPKAPPPAPAVTVPKARGRSDRDERDDKADQRPPQPRPGLRSREAQP